jgi:uncharacterized protein YecE (DUF72 family)
VRSAKAWVGTSGWNYKHWRDEIYPRGLPVKHWLEDYARLFDTVEINNSFYRVPAEGTMAGWQRQTPPGFRFAPKLWRGITHYRRLKNCREFLDSFFRVSNELDATRRGPVLIQLPPQSGKELDRLLPFLDDFYEAAEGQWQAAVEFRNPGWNSPEVDEALAARSVAVCVHDMEGKGSRTEPNDAPFVYLRRHGSHGSAYAGSYSPEETVRDAISITKWLEQGRDVYVYFNNDIGGHAVRNAQSLKEQIALRSPVGQT